MVKNPMEKPLGTQKLDALDLADYESARTWGRSRSIPELRRFINEQTKGKKRKVRKFIVETNRNTKGWDSKFTCKPKLVNKETKHTVKVGIRTLHKKDVAENIANQLFQLEMKEKKAETQQTPKEKLIYTGPGGKFVSKDFAGAKVDSVQTLSPETMAKKETEKKAKERGDRLRRAIAEGTAKLSAKKLAEEQEKEEVARKAKETGETSRTTMKTRQAHRKENLQAMEVEIIDCTDSDSDEGSDAFAPPFVRIPKLSEGQATSCSSIGNAASPKLNSPRNSADSQEATDNSEIDLEEPEEEMTIEPCAAPKSPPSENSLTSFFSANSAKQPEYQTIWNLRLRSLSRLQKRRRKRRREVWRRRRSCRRNKT